MFPLLFDKLWVDVPNLGTKNAEWQAIVEHITRVAPKMGQPWQGGCSLLSMLLVEVWAC